MVHVCLSASIAVFLAFPILLNAQLNSSDAPWGNWSVAPSDDYQAIVSTCHLDAYSTDTKRPELLPQIYTEDAIASYTASQNLSIGIGAIRKVHVDGVKGFISQHLLSNFMINIADDGMTANASYVSLFMSLSQVMDYVFLLYLISFRHRNTLRS